MEKDSNIKLDALRTDGGMVEDDLLMQFQADILNLPVIRPVTRDATTALGSAYAAGLAVEYFKDLDELRSNWAIDHTWKPNMADDKRKEMYSFWKRAVSKSFDWVG
jgi:glycerol kinase